MRCFKSRFQNVEDFTKRELAIWNWLTRNRRGATDIQSQHQLRHRGDHRRCTVICSKRGIHFSQRNLIVTVGIEDVKEPLLFVHRECSGACEINDGQQRVAVNARRRHIHLDQKMIRRERDTRHADEADVAGTGTEREILAGIDRKRRLHDGHAEVEVIDHDANRTGVDFIGINLAVAIAAINDCIPLIGPVRTAHSHEGVHVGGTKGDHGDFSAGRADRGNAVYDGKRADIDTEQAGDGGEVIDRQQARSHIEGLRRTFFNRDAGTDVDELRDLDGRPGDAGQHVFIIEVQEDRRRGGSGLHFEANLIGAARIRVREAGHEINGGIAQQRTGTLDDRTT